MIFHAFVYCFAESLNFTHQLWGPAADAQENISENMSIKIFHKSKKHWNRAENIRTLLKLGVTKCLSGMA